NMEACALPINLDTQRIAEFCRRWIINEFALFGSVLREDFRPDSDIDVLISFEPDIPWSLFEWVDMIEELRVILGREVDLVEKSGLRNPFRRREILSNRQVIYAM
ncbi:MAG TPA: nucleotidyltransferase family protein, partial [Desulfobaccales bacterium]